jgi:Fe2+ or Zn2+ uptake regulation protein
MLDFAAISAFTNIEKNTTIYNKQNTLVLSPDQFKLFKIFLRTSSLLTSSDITIILLHNQLDLSISTFIYQILESLQEF